MKNILIVIFIVLGGVSDAIAQTLAFPGAEGHGRFTTGGRGGQVYYVTTLEDTDTPGSLRYAACSSTRFTQPLTILFKVSGTIRLKKNFEIKKSNLTIAGQSAPGDGICLRGFPVTVKANNVIIRFMRFRMGDAEAISAAGSDALGMRDYTDLIVDHCSMSWCTDECVSIYGNKRTTLQWCIVSESLRLSKHDKGPHAYGAIWGGQPASFLHNLVAHNDSRNPRLGPSNSLYPSSLTNEVVDMRNNVIYNWSGNSCYGGEAMNVNIVANYYKPGPATPTGSKRGRIISIDKKTDNSMPTINNCWGSFFIDGNVVDDGKNNADCNRATNDNWKYGVYNQFASGYGTVSATDRAAMQRSSPVDFGEVLHFDARTAYERVLEYAGASLKRDSYDQRIAHETRTGTAAYKGLSPYNGQGGDYKSVGYPKNGIIDSQNDLRPDGAGEEWSPWPTLITEGSIEDADADGMPDAWELANGLNPNDASDGSRVNSSSGYTNLEVYLHSLVAQVVNGQAQGGMPLGTDAPLLQADAVQVQYDRHSGLLHIDSDPNIVRSLSLFNLSGTLCHAAPVNADSYRLYLERYPSGVYLLSLQLSDHQSVSVKFLK